MMIGNWFEQRVVGGWRRSPWRIFACNKNGTAAIEFAVVALILVVMGIGVADLGMGFYRKMQVQNAAQAGAQYAIRHGFAPELISNAVTSATRFSNIVASPAARQYCGCPTNTGIVEIADCSSNCVDGSKSVTYVEVAAEGTYETILPYPLFPKSFKLTALSTAAIP
jgi:hypothetical protein